MFDLTGVPPGTEFSVSVRQGGSTLSNNRDAMILAEPTASVTFNDLRFAAATNHAAR